jgi:hypothetical protein
VKPKLERPTSAKPKSVAPAKTGDKPKRPQTAGVTRPKTETKTGSGETKKPTGTAVTRPSTNIASATPSSTVAVHIRSVTEEYVTTCFSF